MIDIREYKGLIRAAVKSESDRDANWKWKVKSVGKKAARFGWGYLDWLGEKDAV